LLGGGTFDYIYGANGNTPIAQIDTSDQVTDELVSSPENNVCSIVEVSASAANPDAIADYTDYDAYGNPMTKSGGATNPGGLTTEVGSDPDSLTSFGFGGAYTDATSIDYLVHRYYLPNLAQFMSVDPKIAQTVLVYAYANDSPTIRVDPLGMKSKPVVWLRIGCGSNVGQSADQTVYLDILSHCGKHFDEWYLGLKGPVVFLVDGLVTETGMAWWLNGVFVARGTEHMRPAYDHFHGIFAPVRPGNHFNISDVLSYSIPVPGGDATVTDSITPHFIQTKGPAVDFTMT
jgi:RHS repeat-associated protein